jgi:hypothetical protein
MKIGNLEVYGVIYKITNIVNKKVYIGQTVIGFNERYANKGTGIERVYWHHKSRKNSNYAFNKHLLSSIENYKFKSFYVCKIFDIAFSKIELDIKEDTYIKLYKTLDKKYGYNHKEGGGNGKLSESITDNMGKSIIQLSLKGKYIKTWANISKAQKTLNISHILISNKKSFRNSYNYIWIYEDEYDKNYNYFKDDSYILLDTKGIIVKEYSTKDEILKKYKITSKYLNECKKQKYLLKGKYNVISKEMYLKGDYIVRKAIDRSGENNNRYGKKANKEQRIKLSESHKGLDNHQSRKVICFPDRKVYSSLKQVKEELGICRSTIIRNIKGECKTGGKSLEGTKLTWMYYDEYLKINS